MESIFKIIKKLFKSKQNNMHNIDAYIKIMEHKDALEKIADYYLKNGQAKKAKVIYEYCERFNDKNELKTLTNED